MKAVDLSIIIVSYNTKDFIKNCLTSIVSSIGGNLSYEIIVVDNASSDASASEISNLSPRGEAGKSQISNLRIIQNKKNVGFSRANNIGIKEAKGKYLLFLNPDTIVYPNTLETIVEFMNEHKDAGAATCKVVMPNGELDDASHRGFPTPWNSFAHFSGLAKVFPRSRLFGGYNLGWMDLGKTHEIEALAGAFMMVRSEAGQEVDWWDEDYFFYGEDIDFCYQLKAKGWKIYYVPEVSILHYKGISGGIKKHSQHLTTADKETKLRATRARFEAMKIFYKKHYLEKYSPIITWLVFWAISMKLWLASKKV